MQFLPHGAKNSVVIDVAVVSDKHLHQQNPIDSLMEEFSRRIHKAFPDRVPGGFNLNVEPISLEIRRGSRVLKKLRLPHVHQFKRSIFNERFDSFLVAVTSFPNKKHTFAVKNDEVDVAITFEPGIRGLTGGHPVYTNAHSKTSNPVANALHAKARQLKASRRPGPFGIVLCDGDCDLMTRRQADWSSFHLDEIIKAFLQRNQSISFVMALSVLADNSGRIGPGHLRIERRLYLNATFSDLDVAVKESVQRITEFLPPPARTATNARNHLEWVRKAGQEYDGDSFQGDYSMSDRSFKVSLRTIQRYLTGGVDCKWFDETHGFEKNPFLRNLQAGRLITKVEIERGILSEDDDWLVFTFGEPDPSISPFRMPSQKVDS